MQKFLAIGRVGKDPELRRLENGTAVAKLSLATSERFKNQSGETQEKTEWHSLVFWKQRAELVEKYVKKGDRIYVEGKVTYRTVETDNGKKYYTEIVCNSIEFLTNKNSDGNSNYFPKEEPATTDSNESPGDDLPF